jgi:hypothetical protein
MAIGILLTFIGLVVALISALVNWLNWL